jgi:hypothetical protein
MKLKPAVFTFLLACLVSAGYSQQGGTTVYNFLSLPASPKVTALGGSLVPVRDNDIHLVLQNPSLLSPALNNQFSFSFMDYFAGSNTGNVVLVKHFEKYGTFSGAMQFMDYGGFLMTDETGTVAGSVEAADYALTLGWGRQLDSSFSFGVSADLIASSLGSYSSYGMAFDIAATYTYPQHQLSFVGAVKNLGIQFKPYTEGNREPLPLEIQFGISKQLSRAPLRFSLTGQHLERPDLTYSDPQNPLAGTNYFGGDNTSGEPGRGAKAFDKVMRHMVFGTELLLTKNFHIQLGYNYLRRKELSIAERTGLVGFSWGFSFRVSRFHLNFGRGTYHLAGGTNHFSITTNLSEFKSKRNKQ